MALRADALVTLAEAKGFIPVSGDQKDDEIESLINYWSRQVRQRLNRRLVYWAPPEVEGGANIVASVALANGALTLAAQPDSAGRTLIVTITDTDRSITGGTITIVGTVAGASKTVTLTLTEDGQLIWHVPYFFTALSSITVTVTGTVTGDTIKVGSSEGYVDFFSPRHNDRTPHKLKPLDWPIIEVAAVHEDTAREYEDEDLLDADTEFEVSAREYLVRLDTRLPVSWACGYRAIKARYAAGYFGIANVPGNIKDIVLDLVAWAFRYGPAGGRQGMQSGTDAAGSWVLQGPPLITTGMEARLADERSLRFDEAPERDFDLEAA